MLILYYILPEKRMRSETFLSTLEQLPIAKKRRIRKIRDNQAQLQSIIGLKLLKLGFESLGLRKFHLRKLSFPANKPVLYNASYFSISHSENCICCVISKTSAIGIDVEKIRFLSAKIINRYHLKQEKISPVTAWTRKEAVLKVYPEDSLSELKEIQLKDNAAAFKDRHYFINSFTLEKNFTMSIARLQPNTKIKIKRVYF